MARSKDERAAEMTLPQHYGTVDMPMRDDEAGSLRTATDPYTPEAVLMELKADPEGDQIPLVQHISSSSGGDGGEESGEEEVKPKKKRWYTDLYENEDWLSCYVAFVFILEALVVVLASDSSSIPHKPLPIVWTNNPFDAIPLDVFVGVLLVWFMIVALNLAKDVVYKTKTKNSSYSKAAFIKAFLVNALISFVSFWLGAQSTLKDYGLGYAFWSILLGIIVANVASASAWSIEWIVKPQQTKFYLKVGLVLMGIRLQTLAELGPPGILTSWAVTPVVIVLGYAFSVYVLKIENKAICMCMACGVSVCGGAAAIAVASVCRNSKEDVTLVIGLITLFTTPQIIGLPFLVRGVGMDDMVAGAWFGGSLDHTAAVVAAGDMVSPTCSAVAATVKIMQNAIIGFVVLGVSIYWVSVVLKPQLSEEKDIMPEDTPAPQRAGLGILWEKFPKFVIGFLIASAFFSFVLDPIIGKEDVDHVIEFSKSVSTWYFCLFFVGIGLDCDIRKMAQRLTGGKLIAAYWGIQAIDLLITFLIAWISFSGKFWDQPDMDIPGEP